MVTLVKWQSSGKMDPSDKNIGKVVAKMVINPKLPSPRCASWVDWRPSREFPRRTTWVSCAIPRTKCELSEEVQILEKISNFVKWAIFSFRKIDQFYLSHFEGPSISSNPLLRLSLVQKRQIIGVLDRSEIDPFFKKIPELLTSWWPNCFRDCSGCHL